MMSRRNMTQIMLGTAIVGLLAASPSALAYPKISLAGVHLGMSHQQVRHVLGRPLQISGLHKNGYEEWEYRQHLTVSFESYPGASPASAVARVTTRSPIDELPGGAHVGSPWRQVGAFKPRFCFRSTYEGPYNYFCEWYPTLKNIGQKPGQTNPVLCKPIIVFAQSEDLRHIAQLTLAYVEPDGPCPGIVVKS